MDRRALAEFLDSGVAMLGASADGAGRPEAFRVWGATIDGDGRIRALASSEAGRTLEAARTGNDLALLLTDITSYRSVQVKGRVQGPPEPPGPDDAALMRRYNDSFVAALAVIGHPPLLADRLRPLSVFAVTLTVDELYDQTPGLGAGARLGGVG